METERRMNDILIICKRQNGPECDGEGERERERRGNVKRQTIIIAMKWVATLQINKLQLMSVFGRRPHDFPCPIQPDGLQ